MASSSNYQCYFYYGYANFLIYQLINHNSNIKLQYLFMLLSNSGLALICVN